MLIVRISLRMTAAAVAFGFIFGVVTTASAQGTSGGLGNRPQGGANQGGQGGLGQGGVAPRNTAPAAAPAPAAGSSGPSVVVIDIGEVFKQHAQFNSQLNSLKEEIKGLDGYYQGEQKKIAQKRDQMSTFNAGTPEYKRAEEEMARLYSGVPALKVDI
ncbi:MAG TPA: hypothetical protein PLV92_12305 [Pirellulaceae bacterium]|nr:hypothetical protein [Pirellulaceae bacterium]